MLLNAPCLIPLTSQSNNDNYLRDLLLVKKRSNILKVIGVPMVINFTQLEENFNETSFGLNFGKVFSSTPFISRLWFTFNYLQQ